MFSAIPVKFRTKLFLSYALSTTLLWSCLSLWSYHTAYKSVRSQAEQVMASALEQDVRAVNASLAQVESTADLVCNDAEVLRYFQQSFNTAGEEYEQSVRMLRSVDSLLRGMARSVRLTMLGYHPELKEIVPFDFENRFELHGFSGGGLGTQGQVDIAVYRAERFLEEAWPAAVRVRGGRLWMQTPDDAQNGTVSLVQSLAFSRFSESAGVVKLSLRMDELLPLLCSQPEDTKVRSYVLCAGELLGADEESVQSWRAVVDRIPQAARNPGEITYRLDSLTAYTAHLNNGWQVTRVYTYQSLGGLSQIRFQFVTVLLLSLLTTFGLSYFIAHHFSARIHSIGQTVSQFAQGQLNVRAPYQGDEELDELALGFNKMAGRIQALIRDVYQTQILQQQQRLAMLQSQIRPHFLYNSLSAVVRLSERGDMPSIKAIAMALVRFYRISLSKGQDQIPLRDEVEHVRAYLEVCAIRYQGSFTCALHVSPESERCYVPKIILQPFVENALEHGMVSDQLLHIRIQADVHAGALLIAIQDDGVGLDAQALAALEAGEQSSKNGYGIHNVRERIRLTFGTGWGVYMSQASPMACASPWPCPRRISPPPRRPAPRKRNDGRAQPRFESACAGARIVIPIRRR